MVNRPGPIWADLEKPDFMVESERFVPVYVTKNRRDRNQGLLYSASTPGIVWITKCNGIHTIAMRFTIDVAYMDRHNRILEIVTYPPGRIGRPRFRASSVLEAQPGTFAELGLKPGVIFAAKPAGEPESEQGKAALSGAAKATGVGTVEPVSEGKR
ncbi:DUF192 domain-containing protein [uncultured Mobiluncus sp.]|uniref:DUF192 domain-containing protein n=1 Tax=uncultured Mobiluncus sp. TaxID=293425 RepID=UPI00288A5FF4|nr:DUF192 domain-containing protein [uncultured Mobiluncus sp.]